MEEPLGFLDVQVPGQGRDAASREAAFAAVVGDAGEVARQRREPVHLPERLLAARGGPARDHGAPAAGREHQQIRAPALYEIIDPDAVDRCEWHGVSCPVWDATGFALMWAGENYKRRGSCTAIFHGPTRREGCSSCPVFSSPASAT